jgi:hypothetical protein
LLIYLIYKRVIIKRPDIELFRQIFDDLTIP